MTIAHPWARESEFALEAGSQSRLGGICSGTTRSQRAQRFRNLLQQQGIRLQSRIDLAVFGGELLLLDGELSLKVGDAGGKTALAHLILRQIYIQYALRGVGQVVQIALKAVGKSGQRRILEEGLNCGRGGREAAVQLCRINRQSAVIVG